MNDNNIRNNEQEGIAFSLILQVLWDKVIWVALAVVLCVALAFGYTKATYVPKYTSDVTIYASTGKMESSLDITISTFFAEDYAKIIRERDVLKKAIELYELDTTWQKLQASTSVVVEEESRVVYIAVTDTDPEQARLKAEAISEVAKTTMVDVMGADRAVTISEASLPTKPSGSGMVLNLIIGFLAGLCFSGGFFVVSHVIRDRIDGIEDLERALGVTALGVIPYQKKKENDIQKKGELA